MNAASNEAGMQEKGETGELECHRRLRRFLYQYD